jgi:hypothetical protein
MPGKKTGGRPAFEVTPLVRAQVESLAGLGLKRDQIADVIGCSPRTLQRSFAAELRVGDAKATAMVATSLYTAATSWLKPLPGGGWTGSPDRAAITAAIWWEKSRGGRSEKLVVDSKVNAKTETSGTLAVSTTSLTPEQYEAAARALSQKYDLKAKAGLGDD